MVRFPKCRTCGKEHALGGCPEFQSTVRKNVTANKTVAPAAGGVEPTDSAVSAKQPVDTLPKPKIGRPRTGFNKKEYNRQFTADLRALRRLGLECTVKEYRSMKDARND